MEAENFWFQNCDLFLFSFYPPIFCIDRARRGKAGNGSWWLSRCNFLFCFMKLADLYRWTYVSWCVIDLIASKNWRKRLRLLGSFRFFVYRSPEASIYMNRIFICIHVHGWTYTRTRTNKFIRTNRHFIFFCFQINCLFLMVISMFIFK